MRKWFKTFNVALLTTGLLLATSCGNQPKLPEVPGVQGPFFNILDGKLRITMKLLKANWGVGAEVPIPHTQDSSFAVSPNVEDGGTLLVFTLDIDDLQAMDIGAGESHTLPDGRAIPGIPGGVLENSLRVDTDVLDMSFYYNKTLFGLFIPMGWDTYGFGGSFNVVINGKVRGVLGAVASDDEGNGAGLTLFLKLEALKDRDVQKLLRLSKRNPHRMY